MEESMSGFWSVQTAMLASSPPVNEMEAVREFMGDPQGLASPVDWPGASARFGLQFPEDYREFVDTYGPGEIGGVRIMSPEGRGRWNLGALLARKSEEGIALPIYPESGGVVSWGESNEGYALAWVPIDVDPDKWLVVVIGPGSGVPYFALEGRRSFSAALLQYLNPETRIGLIPTSEVRGPVRFARPVD